MSFQYPSEVSGVTISNFLRTALNAKRKANNEEPIGVMDFRDLLKEKQELLKTPDGFEDRYLNEGFSGGEKKKCEILQMAVLDPIISILDESDSGTDIDALKVIAESINRVMDKNKIILIITHYKRILEYVKPDKLSILIDGKIALDGGPEIVDELEEKGYGWIGQEN